MPSQDPSGRHEGLDGPSSRRVPWISCGDPPYHGPSELQATHGDGG
jgi:hypothetical protein